MDSNLPYHLTTPIKLIPPPEIKHALCYNAIVLTTNINLCINMMLDSARRTRVLIFLTRGPLNEDGWGAWIRTRDHGIKTHCLTAWLHPNVHILSIHQCILSSFFPN